MKLKTKTAGSGDFEYQLCPEGTHDAVCVAVVDLGTQPPSGKFVEQGPKRKVYLVFELVEEATRPLIAKDYTASLHEKSALRKVAEAVAGRKFGDDEEIDIARLAGRKCLISVTHTGAERKYHNVSGVLPAKKNAAINDPQHKPFTWFLDDGTPFRGPDWLPFWYGKSVEEVVANCAEMRKGSGQHSDEYPEDGDQGGDNEIPF